MASSPSSMASPRAFLAVALMAVLLAVSTASAAGAQPPTATMMMAAAAAAEGPGLAERLIGEGPQQCWESLMEIKSCTGEIILFFLNGEAYLGPGCCRAIRVIEQLCWAADAMLSVIGFTPEEGDMLKGYCDDGEAHRQHPAPPPHPALDGVLPTGAVAASVAGRKGLGAPLDG
ncbi:egg cell-secreted protein 1.1 [Brachypodium distachyon]|uniref:Prolamin-like domain-containing protein n=1 Tax=Brachypodium distachyon TaxID=15368 RepID=A0A2K2DTG3_BRADI|nr:egg cell-secreted protein 1.1 [Brachypodium distachyon]PNT77567.1 hypothetical protein BRADI_1g65190v3 [Brachypodium distachyon]|eukprot:XP_003561726.2 egg cell-secreted protein 1.1 [Brachypodium distachyon]